MNSLEQKITSYKIIARDTLRMNLISPRLSTITSLENDIKTNDEHIAEIDHNIKVETYEISKLDTDHPNYDKKKVHKEEKIKSLTESKDSITKANTEINKEITKQKEAIAKIESGETKVSLEDLNCLVEKMTKQDAINQVQSAN